MNETELIIQQNKTIIKQLKMLLTIVGKSDTKEVISGKGEYADMLLNKHKKNSK